MILSPLAGKRLMPAKVFVDSNIWLYSLIQKRGDSKHQSAALFMLSLERPVISSQIIREVCSNLIKKLAYQEERILVLINGWYQDCEVRSSNQSQHQLASRLRTSYSLSYWDSLIVAAALDAGCTKLYSEDMQHNQLIEQCLTVINPFKQN